jgi:hypothetical protein
MRGLLPSGIISIAIILTMNNGRFTLPQMRDFVQAETQKQKQILCTGKRLWRSEDQDRKSAKLLHRFVADRSDDRNDETIDLDDESE